MSDEIRNKKYCIVKYTEDNILNVVSGKSLKTKNTNKILAPYKNMGHYEAVILGFGDNKKKLEEKLKEIKSMPTLKISLNKNDVFKNGKTNTQDLHVESNQYNLEETTSSLEPIIEDVSEIPASYSNLPEMKDTADLIEETTSGLEPIIEDDPEIPASYSNLPEMEDTANPIEETTSVLEPIIGTRFNYIDDNDDSVADPDYLCEMEEDTANPIEVVGPLLCTLDSKCDISLKSAYPEDSKNVKIYRVFHLKIHSLELIRFNGSPCTICSDVKDAPMATLQYMQYDFDEDDSCSSHAISETFSFKSEEIPNPSGKETLVMEVETPNPYGIININKVETSKAGSKKYFCKFCQKHVSKIARHLQNVHKDEEEVKVFSLLAKGCPERKRIIHLIRSAGSFMYNTNSAYNKGDLLVSRRPKSQFQRNSTHYECCPNCKASFSKITLRRHASKCLKPSQRTERSILVMGKRIRSALHQDASSIVKNSIFPYLREDNIVKCIRYDELIIRFCNQLCMKYRSKHHHKMIRSQLRLIGRFLFRIKEIESSIELMSDVFNPKYFNSVIQVIGEMGQFDERANIMKKPNVPLHMGTILKKLGKFHISECIKSGGELNQKRTENFLTLLTTDFNAEITQTALDSRLSLERRKKVELPSDSDVHKFLKYILENMKKLFDKLSVSYSFEVWKQLQCFCLLWIICFNRRRVGEVQMMNIVDFNLHHGVDKIADKDIYNSLSEEGKEAACNFKRVSLRGKKGRTVHILLCKLVFKSVNLILKYRHMAKVPAENNYVFGLPGEGRERFLEACELLRVHSGQCGASRPDLLRGTHLRKHIATRSVLLNLNDTEISDLANYMGHHENIHKSHYRLPIVAREITEISKLLKKAQGGDLSNLDNSHSASFFQELDGDSEEDNSETEEIRTSFDNNIEKIRTSFDNSIEKINKFLPSSKKIPWKEEEIEAIKNQFQKFLVTKSVPTLSVCNSLRSESSNLQNRSPQAIMSWIRSEIDRNSPCKLNTNKTPVRRRWNKVEEKILIERFSIHYNNGTLPSLKACQEVINENPIFQGRTPEVVKAKVNNELNKLKRKL